MHKPTIPDVIDRFRAYYQRNPLWGSLHVVLADRNTQDSHVDFCIEDARERGDFEGEALARLLRRMSRTQRGKLGTAASRGTRND
jgi:hypothetical protein